MTGSLVLLFVIVLGRSISSIKAYILCYNCVGAASAADCDRITKCDDQQDCFEEKVVNNLNTHYNSGCRSKTSCQAGQSIQNGTAGELIACSKCCDTDFCNVGLCGGGTPINSLQCLGCSGYTIEISDCNRIEQCAEDEMCYAHRILAPSTREIRYETGCRSRVQCQGLAQAPFINQCFECCDTPMCNLYKCGSNWTAVMHLQTTSSPTQVQTTLSTTTVWSLAPPHISGLMTINLNADTILSCNSNEPGVTYTWLYQGSCQAGQSIQNGTAGELIACSKCCDTDFCNVGLCGGGTPINSLQCLGCSGYTIEISDCNRIEQCAEDEMCYAHRILAPSTREIRYETGCRSRVQCQGLAQAPFINQCFECCDTPMCNLYKCGSNWTAVMHLQTTSSPTQVQTTLSTTTVWSLAPPHISGLMTINLNADTILSCNSNEPGVTYTWLYQGSKSLPLGVSIIGESHLAIVGATSSNVGTFTCVINKNGHQAASNAHVTIISGVLHFETTTSTDHAHITLPTTTVWSLAPPHISGLMTISLNADTILFCNSSEPGVTYTWLYQGSKSLPLGVSVSRGNHLVIFGAKSSNVGTYTCVINKNGHQATSDANVTIVSAVNHLQTATSTAQHHVTLPTTTVWSLAPPHISGLMTINLNANTILSCYSSEPGVTYTWLYQGSRLLPLGVHLIDQRFLAIYGAKSSNVGTFTCVIHKNGHHAATKANVTIISVKAHVTSVIASPNNPQAGHRVDIHCNVTGYPHPSIYWSYTDTMGRTIVPPEISYPDPATVRINNFQPSLHGGIWSCIAKNSLGVDRHSIQM